MKPTSPIFRLMALIGLLIFITVQFFLIYNTYQIKSESFFSKEREIINSEYSKAITNDRIYPGGQAIIDSIYYRHRDELKHLYYTNRKVFNQQSKVMMDSIFSELATHNNLDKLLDSIIIYKHNITKKYNYVIGINKFDISFRSNDYIQLYPFVSGSKNFEKLGGNLINLNPSNLVTSLTVSSPTELSNRITFQLYIQSSNKTWGVLKTMMSTFLLSIASVITIVSLFFITINNWFKQKKLAEMQLDFINSISHEFNTPLTAIIIANKTLQNDRIIPQTDKLKSLTDIIQRQSARLEGLFKQTLNTTKSNQSFLNKQKENITQLVDKIINDYKTNLNPNTSINFESHIPTDTTLDIDAFWFTTMLQNIIGNAIKYNNSPNKTIDISLVSIHDRIQLKFKDNGIGMTTDTIKKIFDKFYRYNDKTFKNGGLGLGLFYVKECIKLHNWEIEVQSDIGIGSEFIVTLR